VSSNLSKCNYCNETIGVSTSVQNDKYTFRVCTCGNVSILRNGEDWIKELSHGAKAFIALIHEHADFKMGITHD